MKSLITLTAALLSCSGAGFMEISMDSQNINRLFYCIQGMDNNYQTLPEMGAL